VEKNKIYAIGATGIISDYSVAQEIALGHARSVHDPRDVGNLGSRVEDVR